MENLNKKDKFIDEVKGKSILDENIVDSNQTGTPDLDILDTGVSFNSCFPEYILDKSDNTKKTTEVLDEFGLSENKPHPIKSFLEHSRTLTDIKNHLHKAKQETLLDTNSNENLLSFATGCLAATSVISAFGENYTAATFFGIGATLAWGVNSWVYLRNHKKQQDYDEQLVSVEDRIAKNNSSMEEMVNYLTARNEKLENILLKESSSNNVLKQDNNEKPKHCGEDYSFEIGM